MTYVVTEACIKCKFTDCVEVCPVDCFYEGENMLVINPAECIDCGVCQPECPVDAIVPDTVPGMEKWVELNAEYAQFWPNITRKKEPLEDAEKWGTVPNKFPDYFSPKEGASDQLILDKLHILLFRNNKLRHGDERSEEAIEC